MRIFRLGVLATLLLLLPLLAGIAAAATEAVYAQYKEAVLQVKIIDRASGSKTSIGSGFVVSRDGLLVTNYHVISDLVQKPERYRVEYLREDGSSGELLLQNLDVVHDLALLRGKGLTHRYLRLASDDPPKGTRLFSFGNPHDLGLTIVEGTFNGLLENSLYEKIHFTGSINPGMSGGPVLNQQGQVVGVNVATAGNQIGFLVPAKYVAALIASNAVATDPAKLSDRVRDELLANQARYMSGLLAAPLEQELMDGFLLPVKLAPFIKCWGDSRHEPDDLYEQVTQSCATSDDIFLSGEQSTGVIRFRHDIFTSSRLGPLRFYGFLERQFNNANLYTGGDEESVENFECKSDFVEQDQHSFKVVYCLRGYKKLAGLYDVFLTVATLDPGNKALQSSLVLSGVSAENAQNFSKSFLEAIRWKP